MKLQLRKLTKQEEEELDEQVLMACERKRSGSLTWQERALIEAAFMRGFLKAKQKERKEK